MLLHGNGAHGTGTSRHLLSWTGTFLASFLLQLAAFLHPPFVMEKMAPCPRQGAPSSPVRAGVLAALLWGAPFLLGSLPPSLHLPAVPVLVPAGWARCARCGVVITTGQRRRAEQRFHTEILPKEKGHLQQSSDSGHS